jgi:hypothetical protein
VVIAAAVAVVSLVTPERVLVPSIDDPVVPASPGPVPTGDVGNPATTARPEASPSPVEPSSTPARTQVTPGPLAPTALPTTRSATTAPAVLTPLPIRIDAGGGPVDGFSADPVGTGNAAGYPDIDIALDGVTGPGPLDMYRTCRWGPAFDYPLTGLVPGQEYLLRLHWAELDFEGAGERVFEVRVDGSVVLDQVDVVAETGGRRRAMVREVTVTADEAGRLVVEFRQDGPDNPFLSGLELLPA